MMFNKQGLYFKVTLVIIVLIFVSAIILLFSNDLLKIRKISNSRFNNIAIELNNKAISLWNSEQIKGKPGNKSLEKVFQILDSAISFDSSYYIAYANKANLLCSIGRRSEAVQVMSRSVKNNPRIAESYQYLGILFESEEGQTESISCYSKALELFKEQYNKKHLLNSRSNEILMMKMLGRNSEADSLIKILPKEFPDKEKEIDDLLSYYAKFNREEIINNVTYKKNRE